MANMIEFKNDLLGSIFVPLLKVDLSKIVEIRPNDIIRKIAITPEPEHTLTLYDNYTGKWDLGIKLSTEDIKKTFAFRCVYNSVITLTLHIQDIKDTFGNYNFYQISYAFDFGVPGIPITNGPYSDYSFTDGFISEKSSSTSNQFSFALGYDSINHWVCVLSRDTVNCIAYDVDTKKTNIYKYNHSSYAKGIYDNEKYIVDGVTVGIGYNNLIKLGSVIVSPIYLQSVIGDGKTSNLAYQAYYNLFNYYTPTSYPNNSDDQGSNPSGKDPDTGKPDGTTDYDPTDTSPSNADNTSDDIFSPSKPAQGVTNTGFVTVYNPSITEIQSLATFMWSAEIPDLLKKIFNEPLDAIIDLKLLYAPVTTANRQKIWLGVTETNTSSLRVTQQFTEFDCGSIDVATYFQSFLDYTPYTKISIYLPFIGYRELNTDEVMDSIINLKYMIDIFSGSCVAIITLTKTVGSTQLNSVMYQFDGNCSMEIPFTSLNMQQYISAVLNVASATAQAVTAGQAVMNTPELGRYSKTTKAEWASVNKNFEQSLSNLGNTGLDLISTKPRVSRAGSLAGANASMAVKQAYLIIERPMQQMPTDYAHFMGIPLNLTKRLSSMTGFTVISDIQFSSSIATDEEHAIVVGLLKQGVII